MSEWSTAVYRTFVELPSGVFVIREEVDSVGLNSREQVVVTTKGGNTVIAMENARIDDVRSIVKGLIDKERKRA